MQVILFTNLPPVYQLATAWAARHEHRLKLVVTTPGPIARRSTHYQRLIAAAPPEQDFLVTTRMRRLATYLAPLSADLIVSCSFPYRIPVEVTALPRFGAFNLHPAPLPKSRGPNGARRVYDGETLGATLHRISPEFDAGEVFYRQEVPLPDDASPENVFSALAGVLTSTWEVGLARALDGAAGEPQDETESTYAAPFSEDEHWLDWGRPKATLQRQATALNFFSPSARSYLDDQAMLVERLDPLPDLRPGVPNGTVVTRDAESVDVVVADGLVRVRARKLV